MGSTGGGVDSSYSAEAGLTKIGVPDIVVVAGSTAVVCERRPIAFIVLRFDVKYLKLGNYKRKTSYVTEEC